MSSEFPNKANDIYLYINKRWVRRREKNDEEEEEENEVWKWSWHDDSGIVVARRRW